MSLTKEQLLGMSETQVEKVILPGGGHVFVRSLTASELDAWERSLVQVKGAKLKRTPLVMARFVALVCCNEDATRKFSDDDVPAIGRMRADVVKAIYDAGQRFNNADEIEQDEEKNS